LSNAKKFEFFLNDILDAIEKIFVFVEGMDFDSFLIDEKQEKLLPEKSK